MIDERRVSLFRNGRNQAVRIPKDMALPGTEAILRKDGDRLILEPARPDSLLALLATLEPIDETFPEIEDPLPEAVDV
ncbi:AbrB/MazE/SpoVT family DNA-binding domain-containing protein [Acuticoccus sediminis]|uniref:AbrB/MazE/SpoVT family DNA-binding domain-containing protein n=1 Tax=Acuticoccus sediminis TaxID=2184697 RepID=A0A8B2NJ27_9HYPH|nr:AbrB/MazE/SpoVT family DNA-binding domain-containing protein [Acuticoccus sediminis]RAH95405.1 AbrB/MazE/SpoVT family DNA-binding domain-containing protein [Acuticoccus sediminis]